VELRDYVAPLLPRVEGTREAAGIGDILGKAVDALLGPLVEAVKAIWDRREKLEDFERATIRTQLEATRWPEFTAVV
jgi:hypothetical protein